MSVSWQEPKGRIRTWIQWLLFAVLIKPFMRLIMGIRVQGREHLPEMPFILIANHSSHMDTLVLLSLLPLRTLARVRPVAAADYWTRNPVVFALTRLLFNILPIPRKGITPENNPLALMEKALQEGDSLILYPEGTRSYGETLGPFKPGIAHLLQRHPEIPCVPVYIRNTARILPKGQFLFVPLFVDVVVGPPLTFDPKIPRKEILKHLRETLEALERALDHS